MLNLDRNSLPELDSMLLKKQRVPLKIIAFILLIGGIFCLMNPFVSGIVLSSLVGVIFILSGISLAFVMFNNRNGNFWPVLAAIVMAAAYVIIGYVFMTNPAVGIFTLSVILAALFAVAGVIRLSAGLKMRGIHNGWLQSVIGVLDLIIAVMFITAGPVASVTLVTTIVGIEMLFSAFACFQLAQFLKSQV
ncbi:HdeD family acid-resistance protein [Pantoea sp. 1.19]|uniref:HdeD family acid-resistance protein n=1 Tax=Pantoea sp. 1.19 TaxID=1925589 RepID=UPI000949076B|nr:HdeD family acid-resistance protein [Pantoea sp. 1.19]